MGANEGRKVLRSPFGDKLVTLVKVFELVLVVEKSQGNPVNRKFHFLRKHFQQRGNAASWRILRIVTHRVLIGPGDRSRALEKVAFKRVLLVLLSQWLRLVFNNASTLS